jgi:ankyrin repeat protein
LLPVRNPLHVCAALQGGYTPIHGASLEGHVDVVKVLVEAGVDKDLPLEVN